MEQIQETSSSINPEGSHPGKVIPVDAPSVKTKPGPKAKPKVNVEALQDRMHNLELLVVRMAHQSGVAHTLLKKAGLEPYHPNQGDMSKFKGL